MRRRISWRRGWGLKGAYMDALECEFRAGGIVHGAGVSAVHSECAHGGEFS